MTDYISRDEVLRELCDSCSGKNSSACISGDKCYSYGGITNIPAADVRTVVRGEWVETIDQNGWEDVRCATCSACSGSYVLDEWGIDDLKGFYNFCPNCGADMRKEVQE